jgi:hypothetical protein
MHKLLAALTAPADFLLAFADGQVRLLDAADRGVE